MPKKTKDKDKTSFHFNPTAPIACFTFFVSVILLLVSLGMQNWANLSISRASSPNGTEPSYTHKIQGPIQRCVQYVLRSNRFKFQDVSKKPQDRCVYMTELDCSNVGGSLVSAHVLPDVNELFNIDDTERCVESKFR